MQQLKRDKNTVKLLRWYRIAKGKKMIRIKKIIPIIILFTISSILFVSFSPITLSNSSLKSYQPLEQKTKSDSLVVENFIVKTLQAESNNQTVKKSVPVPTNTPTILPTSSQSNSAKYFWWSTSTPDPAIRIIPTDTKVSPSEYACNVVVNSPKYYQQMGFGEDFDFDVTITNTGTKDWDTDMDVMQYTGMRMEIDNLYLYDLDKDYDQAWIIHPGDSVHWKIRMEAPQEKLHDDNKYFATYALVKSRSVEIASGQRKEDEEGIFCPFSFYIYVP